MIDKSPGIRSSLDLFGGWNDFTAEWRAWVAAVYASGGHLALLLTPHPVKCGQSDQ